jgi:hypothetical protein
MNSNAGTSSIIERERTMGRTTTWSSARSSCSNPTLVSSAYSDFWTPFFGCKNPTNVLPSVLEYVAGETTQGIIRHTNDGTVSCYIGIMPSASMVEIKLTVKAVTGGVFTNCATVHANQAVFHEDTVDCWTTETQQGDEIRLGIQRASANQIEILVFGRSLAAVCMLEGSNDGVYWSDLAPITITAIPERIIVPVPSTSGLALYRLRNQPN